MNICLNKSFIVSHQTSSAPTPIKKTDQKDVTIVFIEIFSQTNIAENPANAFHSEWVVIPALCHNTSKTRAAIASNLQWTKLKKARARERWKKSVDFPLDINFLHFLAVHFMAMSEF